MPFPVSDLATRMFRIAAVIALLINWHSHSSAEDVKRRPNVLLIMADDMGYECLTANGGETYKTPRLDQLAKDGIRF